MVKRSQVHNFSTKTPNLFSCSGIGAGQLNGSAAPVAPAKNQIELSDHQKRNLRVPNLEIKKEFKMCAGHSKKIPSWYK